MFILTLTLSMFHIYFNFNIIYVLHLFIEFIYCD